MNTTLAPITTRKQIEIEALVYYNGLVDLELECYSAGITEKRFFLLSLINVKNEIKRIFGENHTFTAEITNLLREISND